MMTPLILRKNCMLEEFPNLSKLRYLTSFTGKSTQVFVHEIIEYSFQYMLFQIYENQLIIFKP